MNGEHRLLLERLSLLAEGRAHLSGGELDELKAAFMMLTSSSAETIAELERLSYEPIAENGEDNASERSGLALAESRLLLSDFIMDLAQLPRSSVQQLACSYEDFQAGITAAWAIVRCFEWSSFDEQHVARYAPEKAQSMLAALVRSLRHYRATGEP
jgi:hypothetical protein